MGERCVGGGGEEEGGSTAAALPLPLGAGSNLTGRFEVVSGRDDCSMRKMAGEGGMQM